MILILQPIIYPRSEDAANNAGVSTKGAAYALKSRAMLYAKRWQDAYDAANNVIALKLYGLTDKCEDAWKGIIKSDSGV